MSADRRRQQRQGRAGRAQETRSSRETTRTSSEQRVARPERATRLQLVAHDGDWPEHRARRRTADRPLSDWLGAQRRRIAETLNPTKSHSLELAADTLTVKDGTGTRRINLQTNEDDE